MKYKFIPVTAAVIIGSIGTAQVAAADDHCPETTAQENQSIVERYIQAVVAKEREVVEEHLHEDLSHNLSRSGIEFGTHPKGELAERSPQDVTVHDVFAADDKVAVRYSFQITGDAIEGASADATTDVHAIAIARIECAQVREVHIEQDVLGLLLEMGMSLQRP